MKKIYSSKYTDVNVKVNGKGWGRDNGADLIITYKEKFDDFDLDISSNKEYKVVIQAKSYKWTINDDVAIQCKTAMNKYNAEYAILVTTAKIHQAFYDKIDSYNSNFIMGNEDNNLGMISLVDGEKLAKLCIKYMD